MFLYAGDVNVDYPVHEHQQILYELGDLKYKFFIVQILIKKIFHSLIKNSMFSSHITCGALNTHTHTHTDFPTQRTTQGISPNQSMYDRVSEIGVKKKYQ